MSTMETFPCGHARNAANTRTGRYRSGKTVTQCLSCYKASQRAWTERNRERVLVYKTRYNRKIGHKPQTVTSYNAAHTRIRRHLKKDRCALCNTRVGPFDACLRKNVPSAFRQIDERLGLAFSARLEDYFVLCKPCHMKYDEVGLKKRR